VIGEDPDREGSRSCHPARVSVSFRKEKDGERAITAYQRECHDLVGELTSGIEQEKQQSFQKEKQGAETSVGTNGDQWAWKL